MSGGVGKPMSVTVRSFNGIVWITIHHNNDCSIELECRQGWLCRWSISLIGCPYKNRWNPLHKSHYVCDHLTDMSQVSFSLLHFVKLVLPSWSTFNHLQCILHSQHACMSVRGSWLVCAAWAWLGRKLASGANPVSYNASPWPPYHR